MSIIKKIKKKNKLISKDELEQIKIEMEEYRLKCEEIISKSSYSRKDFENLLVYGQKFNKLKKRLDKGLENAKKVGI